MDSLEANGKIYNLTPHASRNMQKRRITEAMVVEVLQTVESWQQEDTGRDVYQYSVQNSKGRWVKVRVIVEEENLLIITIMEYFS